MAWMVLGDLDLSRGAQVRKLPLAGGAVYSGNAASRFEPAKPFTFLSSASGGGPRAGG
jgi:choloylglycine hydrolase